jgi:ATP-dependent DNA helicase RecG
MSRHSALLSIHHPMSQTAYRQARRRLAFEEVFYLQLFMQQRRKSLMAKGKARGHVTDGKALGALKAKLPFTLTADQETSLGEILEDMAQDRIMNRLLLGDVGSGKTIVAALALAAAHDSGSQAAMMAPTEVLAEQYAQKLGGLFDAAGIPWALLTSSTKDSVRRAQLEGLAAGTISVLLGTHAIIEPDVCFNNLTLTIIDEQHRFGVDQRETLCAKGNGCDRLFMTATPIPRSLALTIYGDMDTSYIRTKPMEGVRTTTRVIGWKDIRIAYESLREAVEKGGQAYIVCPLISAPEDRRPKEEEERDDDPQDEILITEFSQEIDSGHIQAAEDEVGFLRAKVFPDKNIGLMTSKLKSAEKRRVMEEFRSGEIDILVSTTVIEVGIDVPNATVMVIEDADRFGLSQLHQLRGRVGRGTKEGEVFLVTGTQNEDSIKRLAVMEKNSDGFALAEYDLKLRREGDVLGYRQHGAAALRLVNVINDADLIQKAHLKAKQLLEEDPLLEGPRYQHLLLELKALFERKEP